MASYIINNGLGVNVTQNRGITAIRDFWGPGYRFPMIINLNQNLNPNKLVVKVEIVRANNSPIDVRFSNSVESINDINDFKRTVGAVDLANSDIRTIIMFDPVDPVFYFVIERALVNPLSRNNFLEVNLGFLNGKICLIILKRPKANVLNIRADAPAPTRASGGVKLP